MTEDEAKKKLLNFKKEELVEAISSICSATAFINALESKKTMELEVKEEEAREAFEKADKEYQDYLSETAKSHGAPKEDFIIIATFKERAEARRLYDLAEEAYDNWLKARPKR